MVQRRTATNDTGATMATATKASPEAMRAFADWWASYPRKVGKTGPQGAMAKFLRLDEQERAACSEGTAAWVRYWTETQTEMTFVPHPATFINQQRYRDTPPPTGSNTAPPDATDQVAAMRAGHSFLTLDGTPVPNPWATA
jgi:hypothetical protein